MNRSKFFKLVAVALLSSVAFMASAQGRRGGNQTPIAPQPPVDPNAPIKGPFKWTTGDIVVKPQSDDKHQIVSVKDPTIVQFDGKYHIYATTSGKAGARGGRGVRGGAAPAAPAQQNLSPGWSFMYINFADIKEANNQKFWYAEQNPFLKGYKCAPQVFYYTPQKKWYLTFQTQPPQYCTADDLTKPETWSKPEPFFAQNPTGPAGGWIDFHLIADDKHMYLYFTNDGGYFFRSRTTLEQFPKGMSQPETAIQMSQGDLFEASQTYKVKDKNCYLTIIEAMSPARYFRAWWSPTLDGKWIPVENASSWEKPFAGINNVKFNDGVKAWTKDMSHGELIRTNYNETPTIDIDNMQFLFQGRDPASDGTEYGQLPYMLGLLKQVK